MAVGVSMTYIVIIVGGIFKRINFLALLTLTNK